MLGRVRKERAGLLCTRYSHPGAAGSFLLRNPVHTNSGLAALETSAVQTLARASKLTEAQVLNVAVRLLVDIHFKDGRPNALTIPYLNQAGRTLGDVSGALHEFRLVKIVEAAERLRRCPTARELKSLLRRGTV